MSLQKGSIHIEVRLSFPQIFNLSVEDMNFGSYIPMADRKLLGMFEVLSRRIDQVEHGVSLRLVFLFLSLF